MSNPRKIYELTYSKWADEARAAGEPVVFHYSADQCNTTPYQVKGVFVACLYGGGPTRMGE